MQIEGYSFKILLKHLPLYQKKFVSEIKFLSRLTGLLDDYIPKISLSTQIMSQGRTIIITL